MMNTCLITTHYMFDSFVGRKVDSMRRPWAEISYLVNLAT